MSKVVALGNDSLPIVNRDLAEGIECARDALRLSWGDSRLALSGVSYTEENEAAALKAGGLFIGISAGKAMFERPLEKAEKACVNLLVVVDAVNDGGRGADLDGIAQDLNTIGAELKVLSSEIADLMKEERDAAWAHSGDRFAQAYSKGIDIGLHAAAAHIMAFATHVEEIADRVRKLRAA